MNNIKLTDRLFLTPEFLPAATKGIREVPLLTTGDANLDALLVEPNSSNRKLNYIDVPVLLKVMISKRFAISAGPSFSFLTGATDTYKSSPIDGSVLTSELDIKSMVSRFDVAGTIDLSYAISQAREGKGLNLYIRYSKGFIDILNHNPGNPFTHSTFQFGATFPFIEE